jgi:mono/diheme cytochrome c family protein
MKKFLKILGVLLLILTVVIAGAVTYVSTALPDVGPPPDLTVEVTPERLERGAYLANHVALCMDCHSTRDWGTFAGPPTPGTEGVGGEVFDQNLGFPGKFVSRNITPTGVGHWTDGELYRAITAGVSRDGSPLFPVMPWEIYGQMDPEDIHSIIAYIRSLPAVDGANTPSEPEFPFTLIMRTLPKQGQPKRLPGRDEGLVYGEYMTLAGGCADCHTKQEKGKKVGEPFAGGFEFQLPGGTLRTPNLTPHETGLANWSREQFIARFKMYEDSSYTPHAVDMFKGDFQTIMPWTMYAGMTEHDLGAIYDYLRTVKPVDNSVVRWQARKP